jgi:hypothetical protein
VLELEELFDWLGIPAFRASFPDPLGSLLELLG